MKEEAVREEREELGVTAGRSFDPTASYFRDLARLSAVTPEARKRLTVRVSNSMRECVRLQVQTYQDAERLVSRWTKARGRARRRIAKPEIYAAALALIERMNLQRLPPKKIRQELVGEVYKDPVGHLRRLISKKAAAEFQNLIELNLRLVITIAKKHKNAGQLTFIELVQEGNLGLIRGVAQFDHRRGYQISTYVTWWIKHSIQRAIDDKGWQVRTPVHHKDLLRRIGRLTAELKTMLDGPPSDDDLAEALAEETLRATLKRRPTPLEMREETPRQLARIEKAALLTNHGTVSLDAYVAHDETTSHHEVFDADPHGEPAQEEAIFADERVRLMRQALAELDARERDILTLRFGIDGGDELTLAEIGEKYGLSRERIRQVEQDAMRRLRKRLSPLGLKSP